VGALFSGKTIIVVDDEIDLREIVSEHLQMHGARVLEAENGTQAFEIATSQRPDAIISDVRMPNGDGVELLKRLRASQFATPPAFVFMTGYADITSDEVAKLGAQGMIGKPFKLQELNEILKKHLLA